MKIGDEMKIFKEILDTHTKICTCRKVYKINDDIEIIIDQNDNKLVMWGVNHKTDRFLNLSTKRFKMLMDGFKSVASDLYSSGSKNQNYYYITIGKSINNSKATENNDKVDIDLLKEEIKSLKEKLLLLDSENNKLKEDLERYKREYLYYSNEYTNLKKENEKGKLNIHNARGAGRKAKFTDCQVDEIKRLRESGNTINEIAKVFNCSVGLIHKLINEK